MNTPVSSADTQLRLQLLLDHMPDGVIAFDALGRIEWINPAARLIFQRGAADCVGQPISQLIPHIGAAMEQLGQAAVAPPSQLPPQVPRFTLHGLRAGNVQVPIEVALVVWEGSRGATGMCVCRDLSQAERIDNMKREFVTMVSHELRTPLTSLRGSLALLNDGSFGTLPRDVERLLRLAHDNAERLVALVNDILDFEKLRAGALRLDSQPLDLRDTAVQAMEAVEGMAQQHDVTLQLQPLPLGGDCEVLADPARLMQVLVNLLSNAIKYSPPGSVVTLQLSRRAERMRLVVCDSGPGVEEGLVGRLFEPFEQGRDAARRKPGTGLGLAISRALMDLMQGGIGLEPPLAGQGARFWIELPSNDFRPSTFGP